MKSLFFIEIPSQQSFDKQTLCQWYKKEFNQKSVGEDRLENIKNNLQGCDVVLVLSGFNVLLTDIELAIKSRKHLLKALAYELEEQLATDIEELFFAYQSKALKTQLQVGVVNEDWFKNLLEVFNELEIDLTAAIAELSLLQALEKEWLLLQKPDCFLLKTPTTQYAIDEENLSYFFKHLHEPLPESVEVICDKNWHKPEHFPVQIIPKRTQETGLVFLAEVYQAKTTLNLLQGDFKPKIKHSWKLAQYGAVACFALLLIATSVKFYQQQQLEQQQQQLTEQRKQIFRRNFPQLKRIVDPLTQMRHLVGKLQQGNETDNDLIGLLAKFATGARLLLQQQSITLESLEFQSSRLLVSFNATSLEVVEKFKTQLKQQQLTVNVESSSTKDNQAVATFSLF